jgi:hypothetical protein
MNEKGKAVVELSDATWLLDLALLYISHHVNDLNTELQGQQKLISNMYGAVEVFSMKLKLFRKRTQDVYLFRFYSCDVLHKNAPVSGSYASVRPVETIDSLAKEFKTRFNDFPSHAINTCTSENLFCVEVSEVPRKL